jgi:rubredoxin
MKRYICLVCGYVYDEEVGDPTSNIAPGTCWSDVPATWICPDCNEGKAAFMLIEV